MLSTTVFANENPTLPDPLKAASGERIETKEQWEKFLRSETLQHFRKNVYGFAPVGKPAGFQVKVLKEVPDAVGGLATSRILEISFDTPGGRRKIHPVVVLPNRRSEPSPCFLLINNRSPDLLNPDKPNEFFPVKEIILRGYAAVGFHYEEIDPDRPDSYSEGIRAAYDSDPPGPDAWGSIAAWAWGASRVLDALDPNAGSMPIEWPS